MASRNLIRFLMSKLDETEQPCLNQWARPFPLEDSNDEPVLFIKRFA